MIRPRCLLARAGRVCSESTTTSLVPPILPLRQLTRSSASYRSTLGIQSQCFLATHLTPARSIHRHRATPPSKRCPDAKTALALSGLKAGDTIAVGGFGLGGIPETLLNALSSQNDGLSSLTVVSLTAGVDSFGLDRLFEAGKVKRVISSYVGENKVSFLVEQ